MTTLGTVAVIPARGGSRRIPRKNIKEFHGKPIIAYSIEKAQESELFRHIVVSTDDTEIADIARQYGAKVHKRSAEYARDEVGTQVVMGQVLRDIKLRAYIACCIYPTSPLMRVEDLIRGYEELGYHEAYYTMSIGYPPLCDAGQFYWGFAKNFIEGLPLFGAKLYGPRTIPILVPSEHICDINTPEDWAIAETMYGRLHEQTG
jgi:pseudaminic acid cytidylyltransferase